MTTNSTKRTTEQNKWDDKFSSITDDVIMEFVKHVKDKSFSLKSCFILWVMQANLVMNDNVCKLSTKELSDITGISTKNIYKYLKELVDCRIAIKADYKGKPAYYLNPHYIKHSESVEKSTVEMFDKLATARENRIERGFWP